MSGPAGELVARAKGAGKLILFGEHSVVYGERAVAIPLSSGLTATAYRLPVGVKPRLSLPSLKLLICEEPPPAGPSVVERLWRVWQLSWGFAQTCALRRGLGYAEPPPVEVIVEGPLPFKVGLGSSAALGLALLQVCGRCVGVDMSGEELSEGAWLTEEVFHDQPSGLDHSVALSRSGLCFQRSEKGLCTTPLALGGPLHLVICWTPRQGGTAEAVRAVRELFAREPTRRAELARLGALCLQAEAHLAAPSSLERLRSLAQLMDEAHQALSSLGVSTPALELLRAKLHAQGALGSKLTGAGFGGAVFGLFSERDVALKAAESLGGLSVTVN